jgi:hypothetical protein
MQTGGAAWTAALAEIPCQLLPERSSATPDGDDVEAACGLPEQITRRPASGSRQRTASWEARAMGSAVVQFEIGGPDDQLLAGFYGALFGRELTPIPGANYTLIAASGTGIGGGLGRSRTGEPWATF